MEGDCRVKKLKKTKKDLQHAAPVSQRRKLKKSTSVALQQQLDLQQQQTCSSSSSSCWSWSMDMGLLKGVELP